jgi:hypothetical protein
MPEVAVAEPSAYACLILAEEAAARAAMEEGAPGHHHSTGPWRTHAQECCCRPRPRTSMADDAACGRGRGRSRTVGASGSGGRGGCRGTTTAGAAEPITSMSMMKNMLKKTMKRKDFSRAHR